MVLLDCVYIGMEIAQSLAERNWDILDAFCGKSAHMSIEKKSRGKK